MPEDDEDGGCLFHPIAHLLTEFPRLPTKNEIYREGVLPSCFASQSCLSCGTCRRRKSVGFFIQRGIHHTCPSTERMTRRGLIFRVPSLVSFPISDKSSSTDSTDRTVGFRRHHPGGGRTRATGCITDSFLRSRVFDSIWNEGLELQRHLTYTVHIYARNSSDQTFLRPSREATASSFRSSSPPIVFMMPPSVAVKPRSQK